MATTNAVIRGRAAIWGIEADSGDTFYSGLILNQAHIIAADEDYIHDNEGFIISEVFFNMRDECDVNVICEDGTDSPSPGDNISIAGVDCIVQGGPELKWQQKGWKVLNIKAKKFLMLTEAT